MRHHFLIVSAVLLLGAGCGPASARPEPPVPTAAAPASASDTEYYVTLPPVAETKTIRNQHLSFLMPKTYQVEEGANRLRVQNYKNPSDSPADGIRDGQFFLEIFFLPEDAKTALPSFRETYGDLETVSLWGKQVSVKKGREPQGGESEPGDSYLVPLSKGHAIVNISSRSESGLSLATLLLLKIAWID